MQIKHLLFISTLAACTSCKSLPTDMYKLNTEYKSPILKSIVVNDYKILPNPNYMKIGYDVNTRVYTNDRRKSIIEDNTIISDLVKDNNIDSKNAKYKLDIQVIQNEYTSPFFMPLLQFLTLGTIHLTGIPTWHGDTVKLKADLKTIDNTQTIKSYEVTGKNASNICAIFYGYNERDAIKKSALESAKDAFSQIIEQINNDKELTKIATRKYNEEQELKKKIQEITKGKKIDEVTLTSYVPSYSDIMHLREDTIYKIISIPRMYDIQERGFFASQNTHNGNLANYYYQGYSSSGVDKVFFYGKNNYLDGQQIENGYYEYMGIYNYTTILGTNKSVPSFRKINIPPKYIDIMENLGILQK